MADEPKVEYYAPEDLETVFADNVGVVYANDRFYLQFFQAEPPVRVEPGNQIPVERSKCVVRIVLTPRAMRIITGSMVNGIEGYKDFYGELAEKMLDAPNDF